MRAFVLNLARRPERLERFFGWNAGHGLDFQVVAAVDGLGLDGLGLGRAALAAAGILAPETETFSDGALGNALSHRGQWLECIAENRPRLICEDDACLRGDLRHHLPRLERTLARADLLFLGYNTDAPLALLMSGGLATETYFGKPLGAGDPGDRLAAFSGNDRRRQCPAVHRALAVWGTIAYAVTPVGARRLLDICFPLSSTRSVRQYILGRDVQVAALDGMISWALAQNKLRAVACLPPLALSPNNASDVNVAAACPSP